MEIFFGVECSKALKKIQGEFEILISQVEAAFYKRKDSAFFIEDKEGSPNNFRKKYMPMWNRLTHHMTELSKEMIRRVLDEDIG
jgi:NAD dependent epimerase/dehydratase family enzyme